MNNTWPEDNTETFTIYNPQGWGEIIPWEQIPNASSASTIFYTGKSSALNMNREMKQKRWTKIEVCFHEFRVSLEKIVLFNSCFRISPLCCNIPILKMKMKWEDCTIDCEHKAPSGRLNGSVACTKLLRTLLEGRLSYLNVTTMKPRCKTSGKKKIMKDFCFKHCSSAL